MTKASPTTGSTVQKVPRTGGDPVTLIVRTNIIGRIAVDGTSVYWTELNGDGVMKLTPK